MIKAFIKYDTSTSTHLLPSAAVIRARYCSLIARAGFGGAGGA